MNPPDERPVCPCCNKPLFDSPAPQPAPDIAAAVDWFGVRMHSTLSNNCNSKLLGGCIAYDVERIFRKEFTRLRTALAGYAITPELVLSAVQRVLLDGPTEADTKAGGSALSVQAHAITREILADMKREG